MIVTKNGKVDSRYVSKGGIILKCFSLEIFYSAPESFYLLDGPI